jgi:hypothetical protein
MGFYVEARRIGHRYPRSCTQFLPTFTDTLPLGPIADLAIFPSVPSKCSSAVRLLGRTAEISIPQTRAVAASGVLQNRWSDTHLQFHEESGMYVQPYLHFDGCAEEALEFYRKAIGAEVLMVLRMNEAPEQPPPGTIPPGNEQKIMHAEFRVGDSTILASDGYCHGQTNFHGITPTPTETSTPCSTAAK